MRVFCVFLLFTCVVSFAYALPPRYTRYSVEDTFNDDEEASVEDESYDDMNDMFTFPTGGPGGPPSNKYMSHMDRGRADTDDEGEVVYVLDSDPEYLQGFSGEQLDGPNLSPGQARQLLRKEKEPEAEDEQEQEDEEEDEEEDDDAGDQDDDSDDEQFGIPDYNKMFPNPQGRPQGPGDYDAYVKHMPQNQPSSQQNQRGSPPPPQRRYRTDNALTTYITNPNKDYDFDDAVVVDAYPVDRSRILQDQQQELDEDEEVDDEEDDEEVDDDVDFSVPSYDTLFPTPSNKQVTNTQLFSGMRNSWNNAPQPPTNRRQHGYGRLVRILQSPMLHDMYNPDYVIDPTIALNRRNERLRYRYSNPNWQRRNMLTPYNYKPILYQQGHWGNPREHDYNPISGDHYLGGIYNGKNYY